MAPSDRSAMSRRAFLAATGGLALAATAFPEVALAHDHPKLGKQLGAVVLSSDLFASPAPQRVVFGLASKRGYVSGPPVSVGFVPPDAPQQAQLEVTPTRFYKAGLPEGRGVYVAEPVLDVPTLLDANNEPKAYWNAVAVVEGRQRPITFALDVKDHPMAPQPGTAAPRAASPTVTDRLGVQPICTRRPRCPLHTISLADVIGTGTPVVVMFATPARCQSQYCGPVLDSLLSVRDRYPDFTFVHVEIYLNNQTMKLTPTMDAWGLLSEPWLFTIDGAGTIVDSIDGAFGTGEIVQLLDALT